MALWPGLGLERSQQEGAAMSFYEKGPVRLHFEEKGSGLPLLMIAGGGLNSVIPNLSARDARPVLRQQHEGLGAGACEAKARHHDGAGGKIPDQDVSARRCRIEQAARGTLSEF